MVTEEVRFLAHCREKLRAAEQLLERATEAAHEANKARDHAGAVRAKLSTLVDTLTELIERPGEELPW